MTNRAIALVATYVIAAVAAPGAVHRAAASSGTGEAWVSRLNGPASLDDGATAIVSNPDGSRVFVTGSLEGSQGHTDYETVAYDATTGSALWTKRYNGPRHTDDVALALALSPDGSRLFVTGYSTGSDGSDDYATIAYEASTGSSFWARRYRYVDGGYDIATSIAVTPDGSSVLVTGQSEGSTSGFNYDYATIAYEASSGVTRWIRRFAGVGGGADVARTVAVSPDGSTTFVGGDADMRTGGSDYVTEALSTSTGEVLWLNDFRRFSSSISLMEGLAMSPDGFKLFVTGSSSSSSFGFDFATIAIDAGTGALLWKRFYDGISDREDDANAIAVSPDGTEVFVTGYSEGGEVFVDFATVAYDTSTGDLIWEHRWNGPGHNDDFPQALAVSPDGAYLYVTGWSRSATSLDDYATVAYGLPHGKVLGVRRYDGPGQGDDHGLAVATSSTLVFVTGESDGGAETGDDFATVAYPI